MQDLQHHFDVSQVQLIIASPLTRACSTALLAFRSLANTVPFQIYFGIREIGSSIPENQPRKSKDVVQALERIGEVDAAGWVDFDTNAPEGWPNVNEQKTRGWADFYSFLLSRPEEVIVVVCHFNVINSMLGVGTVHPANCTPYECALTPDGVLRFVG